MRQNKVTESVWWKAVQHSCGTKRGLDGKMALLHTLRFGFGPLTQHSNRTIRIIWSDFI